jgi:hypothetical protein
LHCLLSSYLVQTLRHLAATTAVVVDPATPFNTNRQALHLMEDRRVLPTRQAHRMEDLQARLPVKTLTKHLLKLKHHMEEHQLTTIPKHPTEERQAKIIPNQTTRKHLTEEHQPKTTPRHLMNHLLKPKHLMEEHPPKTPTQTPYTTPTENNTTPTPTENNNTETPTQTPYTTPTSTATPTQGPTEGQPPTQAGAPSQPPSQSPASPCQQCVQLPLNCNVDNETCGGVNRPKNPCSSQPGVVGSFKCGPSPTNDSCIWYITCSSGMLVGTVARTTLTMIITATNLSLGGASNQNSCEGQCQDSTKPTSCEHPLVLRASDSQVNSDCVGSSGSCYWTTTNCAPQQCLNISNGNLTCGNVTLNCGLPLNMDAHLACSVQSNGQCGWNFQCPEESQHSCAITSNMENFTYEKNPTPTCGSQTRPTCGQGLALSSKCSCASSNNACGWQDNCEKAPTANLCYLNKGTGLGWICGSEPAKQFCSDGSRFIPTYCELSNNTCVARGYCDRITIIQIPPQSQQPPSTQPSLPQTPITTPTATPTSPNTTNTTNTTSSNTTTPTTPTSSQITCGGVALPTCNGSSFVIQPQCVCTPDNNRTVLCYWSNWVCKVDHPCGECENPCADDEFMLSGNCVQGNEESNSTNSSLFNNSSSSNGSCSWVGHQCAALTINGQCTCDDVPASLCPFGQNRDNSSAPSCIQSSGLCKLQSSCVPDMCGGISKNPCTCDYSTCVYILTNYSGSDNTQYFDTDSQDLGSTGYFEGCFSPSSDALQALLRLDYDVEILTSAPSDNCSSANSTSSSQSCQNCQMIVDRCSRRMSDQSLLLEATTQFEDDQQNSRQTIDNQTGAYLGKQFDVTIVVVGKPKIQEDNNSLDIALVTYFSPLERLQQPTDDHKRVLCNSLNVFVMTLLELNNNNNNNTSNSTLSNSSNSSTNSTAILTNCKWEVLLGDNSVYTSNGNMFTVIVNFAQAVVQQAFPPSSLGPEPAPSPAGNSSSPAPLVVSGLTLTNFSNNTNLTTGNEAASSSSSSLTGQLILAMLVALISLFF